jgi:hypothetical protein
MDAGSLLVFFGIAFAVLATAVYISLETTRAMNAAFRKVALRLGAYFDEGGLFDEPQIRLTLAGCHAWILVHRRERTSSPYLRVTVNVRNRTSGKLRIEPVDVHVAFTRRYGPPYVTIGDRDFDRDFAVQSVPAAIASRVFAPTRRDQVMATVRRLKGLERPTIDLDNEYLTVTVSDDEADPEVLMRLVTTAEEMLGYLFESAPLPGIRLEDVRAESCGECQVCGSPLEESVVRCDTCRTPHHRECWTYVGRCTTYACKGRRFVA